MQMRICVTVLLAASIVFGFFLIAYARKWKALPGARYFIFLTVAIMLVNATYIGELNSDTMEAALFWYGADHLFLPFHPYLWLMMCLDYTRVTRHKRLIRNLLLVFPAFYYFVFFTNDTFHLYIRKYYFVSNGYFPVLVSDKGPGFLVILAAITVIGAACITLYVRGYLRAAKLYRGSYLLLIIASVLPWGSTYFNITNSTFLRIDYYSFLMIITALIYLFGLFRYHLFSTVPIETETVYRLSDDGIALVSSDGTVTDVNGAFLRQYPDMKQLTDESTLRSFIACHEEFRGLSPENPEIRFRSAGNDSRYYSAKLTGISSGNGIHVGDILQIKDITLFVEYQNQLKQLAKTANERAETNELSFLQAQISPHFINNTLSAICSLISRDDETAKDLVVGLSEYLISCYRIGNSSPMDTLSHELEAVDTYMKIVTARFGGRIGYTAQITAPMDTELPRLVLQPLVENAVRHGVQPKKDGGTVCLRAQTEGCFVHFEIIDDGVGIEPARIPSLLSGGDDRQGIGMINIHKRLLKYYGEGLSVTGGNGTSVTFRVPLRKAAREDLQ